MLAKREYGDLERALGHRFRRQAQLAEALVHRSFRFENQGVDADNERLEFLGDAVLALLSSAHLFEAFRDRNEGDLTAMRSRIISGKTLALCAGDIELGRYLRMGSGEERSGGRTRASNLANALEAVIGAAFLDGGLKAAQSIFVRIVLPRLEAPSEHGGIHNPKGQLQELTQARWKCSPTYEVIEVSGPPHATQFQVRVVLPDGTSAGGVGRSKQAAETEAAASLLRAMDGAG